MKNKKQVLLSLIIILIIIIIILLSLFIRLSKKTISEDEEVLEGKKEIVSELVGGNKLIRTNNVKLYYTVDECLKSYFTMIKSNDSNVVITYLNEEYIKNQKIDTNNIFNIIDKYSNYDTYRTAEMYELATSQVMVYYVRSRIDSKSVYFMVRLDIDNQTFDIEPITEETYKQRISDKNNTKKSAGNPITKKVYNSFVYKELNDELTTKLYFADYIKAMLTDAEEAYNLLESQYKDKRFNTIDKFKKFIKVNNKRFQTSYDIETNDSSSYENYKEYYEFIQQKGDFGVKKYSVTQYADYTRYICVDGCNNYFIFYATDPGCYTVELDSYTIDSEEFIKKYNSSKDERRVGMNIDKVIQAVNSKDYKYIYNKLDETFKSNNYSSLDSFEKSIQTSFYDMNKIEYVKYSKEGNIYIYNLKVKDAENSDAKEKTLTIIMQLLEGTDFVMSFNIK